MGVQKESDGVSILMSADEPRQPRHDCMRLLDGAIEAISWAVRWIYDLLVTRQLRKFYFETWRGGESAVDSCTRMARETDSDMWRANPEYCRALVERQFTSWARGAITVIYFALLTYFIIKLLNYCWNMGPGRGSHTGSHQCKCGRASDGEYRVVDVGELRALLGLRPQTDVRDKDVDDKKTVAAIKEHS